MSMIKVSNLTFAYEGSYENVFTDASFQLDTDWKLGFTGRNGRGKTTFLNLLMGKHEHQGKIVSSVPFSYFPYEVRDASKDTINAIKDVCPSEEWEISRELSLLGVDGSALERPFCTLSSGERTKSLLAALFLNEGRFLLIDEPTNHLDSDARIAVSEYLKKKKGFILVSHDRAFLDAIVDHILSINKMNIEVQSGNFSSWLKNKTDQDNLELIRNEALKSEIARLKETARRVSDWSGKAEKAKIGQGAYDRGYIGHKAAKVMKRSKSIQARGQQAIEEKSKLLGNIEVSEDLALHPLAFHSRHILRFVDVSASYEGHPVFANVSFSIEQGDRIALKGRNGSGKTTALKLAMGMENPVEGAVEKPAALKISYIPQDTSFLKGPLLGYANECGIDETLFLGILRKLDFSRSQFDSAIEECSDGQKKKILLARSLCERANLYIWDEPLNYIDVYSRIQIEELILKYKPTLLFVEHDAEFCSKIATSEIAL